jgi:hypothetical protein
MHAFVARLEFEHLPLGSGTSQVPTLALIYKFH